MSFIPVSLKRRSIRYYCNIRPLIFLLSTMGLLYFNPILYVPITIDVNQLFPDDREKMSANSWHKYTTDLSTCDSSGGQVN